MRSKSLICMGGVWIILTVLSSLLAGGNSWGQTPLTINYPGPNPIRSGSSPQNLSASGGCPPYTWRLSGGGTLTPSGESAIYVAPASNANCMDNPTITLTDGCRNAATLQLAVSTGTYLAYGKLDFVDCGGGGGQVEVYYYDCMGNTNGPSCYGAWGWQNG